MEQRQKIEELLIERAMKEEAFRKRLLENPGEVLEELTGTKLPDSVTFQVLEETPTTSYLIIPEKPGE